MIGYPSLLIILDKIFNFEKNKKISDYEPTVAYMISVHNEQEIIEKKLLNATHIDYPKDKIEILVVLDNCTDDTEAIVNKFMDDHPDINIRQYESKKHLGKLNAQNEAAKTVTSEMIVMTDANSMFKSDAIKELISYFSNEDIAYVCGKLAYVNPNNNLTTDSESMYWNLELKVRDIESRIQTIANGNGAIYACRKKDYVDFSPMNCHDSIMPYYYALHNRRALFNPAAVAEEKAGQENKDEFSRKVRMNREYVTLPKRDIKTINIFKYGWFSFIYFGHKICRHLLWFNHLLAFVSSLALTIRGNTFGYITLMPQIFLIMITIVQFRKSIKNGLFRMSGYYGMTIWAQYVAIYKGLKGDFKPTWEKVESTR
jgi:cellulose synthase/poly-beta-1,6-N-acetylglucosamine synthase-like glycosyltransferase